MVLPASWPQSVNNASCSLASGKKNYSNQITCLIVGQLGCSVELCFPTSGTPPSVEMSGLVNRNTRKTETNTVLLKHGHFEKGISSFTKVGLNLSDKIRSFYSQHEIFSLEILSNCTPKHITRHARSRYCKITYASIRDVHTDTVL
jgi:hypothetical protein